MLVKSIHELGGKGLVVSIETSLNAGLPGMVLVGFAGKSLDESRERIRSAFKSSGDLLPKKRITVNVSPSDIPKDGAHYDLAIALSILIESKHIKSEGLKDSIVLGELGLNGDIKPIRGLLGKLLSARELGYKRFILPTENVNQATLINDIEFIAADNLKGLIDVLSQDSPKEFDSGSTEFKHEETVTYDSDFADVVGQAKAKRALEIAAAGGHNLMLNGPPGVGKSMLAKALPSIMTSPTQDEVIEITHLHSLTGSDIVGLIKVRPFRSPHHSSSDTSIIGGGQKPKPGEISLAHRGVLFMDELPEFKRSTIESLRQPLEDKIVTVARAKDTVTYPADFILIATKNPCPCGYYGSTKECTCSPIELQRYQKKLSGPILDRIDIHVTVDNVDHKSLLKNSKHEEKSIDIKKRVENAQKIQRERFNSTTLNNHMKNKQIKSQSNITDEAKDFLDSAAQKLDISARVYMKLIKVARTIADLDGSDAVEVKHIAEAIQYRPIQAQF